VQVPIVLDRRAREPLHRQIYDQWCEGILVGRFAPGTRIPSTRELADALRVARSTVATAYDQLLAEGYLQAAHGSGTYVSRELPDRLPTRIRVAGTVEAPPIRLSRYGARVAARPLSADLTATAGAADAPGPGADVDVFPIRVWRRLVARHVRALSAVAWETVDRGAGHEGLRREIAAYLRRARAVRCEPGQVIVVTGSQQALDLCARVLLDPGDVAAVEDPCYPGARQIFETHGALLHPVPVLRDGIAIRDLPDAARLVFVTPSHQLPTGVSMPLARRLELLAWARRRGAVVIEDDYDSEYLYRGAPLPALQGLTPAASVIYVGTFSNVMFPGLRLGYLVVPRPLVAAFASAKWHADRRTAFLEQAALADFLREGHFERHVRRMRRVYLRRRDALTTALGAYLGDDVTVLSDAAGLFLMVRFASGRAADAARRNGLNLTSTAGFYLGPAPPHEYLLRLTAGRQRALREGLRRLAILPTVRPDSPVE
jgi:GntR family transcriptional regulator / MocR family aminotransferase